MKILRSSCLVIASLFSLAGFALNDSVGSCTLRSSTQPWSRCYEYTKKVFSEQAFAKACAWQRGEFVHSDCDSANSTMAYRLGRCTFPFQPGSHRIETWYCDADNTDASSAKTYCADHQGIWQD